MLTDTINIKLSKAGPEDILDQAELDDLQHELTNQVLCFVFRLFCFGFFFFFKH